MLTSAPRLSRLLLLLVVALLAAALAPGAASAADPDDDEWGEIQPYEQIAPGAWVGSDVPRVGAPMRFRFPVFSRDTGSWSVRWAAHKGNESKELKEGVSCIVDKGDPEVCAGHPEPIQYLSWTPTEEYVGWTVTVSFTSRPATGPWWIPRTSWITSAEVGSRTAHVEAEVVEAQRFGDDTWQEPTRAKPLVAGNPARIGYTLVNDASVATTLGVRVLDEARNPVNGSSETVTLAPKQRLRREVPLKTWGMAHRHGEPMLQRRFMIEVLPEGEASEKVDLLFEVQPRPVVTVHGYNSSAAAWGKFPGLLKQVDPRVESYAVGDGQFPGVEDTGDAFHPGRTTKTIRENAQEVATYVAGVRSATGARHVDLVAHSMGGLISRQYVQDLMPASGDDKPVVGHLVQLGTPNMGSPCADQMLMWQVQFPLVRLFPQPATLQLTSGSTGLFNRDVTDLKGVELSNLVGTGLPIPCGTPDTGDIVVPLYSARWTIALADLFEMPMLHTDMTASEDVVRDYVVPRLADAPGTGVASARRASLSGETTPTEPQPATFAMGSVELGADGAGELDLEVPAGSWFGVTAMAPGVDLELVGPDGGSMQVPAAAGGFGMTGATVPSHPAGTWTLRLTSQEPGARTVPYVAQVAGDPLILESTATRRGSEGTVSATVRSGGTAMTGASVTASIGDGTGTPRSVTLLDDGRHGDGVADDGFYAAGVDGLPDGALVAAVRADVPGSGTRWTSAPVTTVTTTPPPTTEPPVDEPPVVQPPPTQPPLPEPSVTQPPVTQPPVTQPRPTLKVTARKASRKGTVQLVVTGSSAGTVRLTGSQVKGRTAKTTPRGTVLVQATGTALKQLEKKRRATVTVTLVLTTATGTSSPVTTKVVLVRRR